jgi:hypothetical protein
VKNRGIDYGTKSWQLIQAFTDFVKNDTANPSCLPATPMQMPALGLIWVKKSKDAAYLLLKIRKIKK